jgi:hypothetical protein
MYWRPRQQRQALYAPDYDAADPSPWAKTGQFFNLLIEVVAIAFFVVGSIMFDWLKLGRSHGLPRH